MGLFNKAKDNEPTTSGATVAPPTPAAGSAKGHPTPSRKEAEAARMARLNPALDPKKAKQLDREARNQQRQRQMNAVEAAPERQLVRDVVDSRFNLGEVALPVMLLLVMASFLPVTMRYAEFVLFAMYGLIVLLLVDTWVMWRQVKKQAAARVPNRSLKGLGFYAWNRQMSFRRWRQPAPRVNRGEKIDDLPLGR